LLFACTIDSHRPMVLLLARQPSDRLKFHSRPIRFDKCAELGPALLYQMEVDDLTCFLQSRAALREPLKKTHRNHISTTEESPSNPITLSMSLRQPRLNHYLLVCPLCIATQKISVILKLCRGCVALSKGPLSTGRQAHGIMG
jgi:hypothetical protein